MEDDEFEQTEESQSETSISNNIDTDETLSNKEPSVSENTEENLDESEDFESLDFVPSSRSSSRETINPFLEQSIEPIENLERDLGGVPNRQTEDNKPQVINAPQYASSRDTTRSYYEAPTDDTYPEQIRIARARSPTEVSLPFDDLPKTRLLNINDAMGWRNQEDTGNPEEQKYKFGSETKKRKNDW